jgi:hypothetical protein
MTHSKASRIAHPEETREYGCIYGRAWRDANREHVREYNRNYYKRVRRVKIQKKRVDQ